jgi:membrane-bound inhibitor of C-type lysozyme
MNTRNKTIGSIVVVAAVVLIIALISSRSSGPSGTRLATAEYSCESGKTMSATFYERESSAPAGPGLPATPGGIVTLTLSDGRDMTLAQTISADGMRYANDDEAFVFWSKGNSALVLEDDVEKSYTGCLVVASLVGNLTEIYSNSDDRFSIRTPQGYTIDRAYQYQAFGPGKGISGVRFTIPATVATGTNLSADSYISVENLSPQQGCDARAFLAMGNVSTLREGMMTYSVASSTGAAAGNRYEEVVYALPETNPCIAIRYYIHYGVLANYPAGTVKEFDKEALLAEFDAIRRTLTIVQ